MVLGPGVMQAGEAPGLYPPGTQAAAATQPVQPVLPCQAGCEHSLWGSVWGRQWEDGVGSGARVRGGSWPAAVAAEEGGWGQEKKEQRGARNKVPGGTQ